MEKREKGCALILIIGLFVGLLTGFIVGFNLASWNFAGTIAEGYTEIIKSETDALYVRYKGKLYKLETVQDHDELNKKIGELFNLIQKHEEEDAEEFKELHDKVR